MIENSEKAVSLTTEERCLPVTHTLGCVVRPCSECVVVAGVDIADCSWWCGRVCIAARCECKCTGLFPGLISIQHLHPTSDIYTPGIGTLSEISLISLGRIHGASFVPEELPILSHNFAFNRSTRYPSQLGGLGEFFQL